MTSAKIFKIFLKIINQFHEQKELQSLSYSPVLLCNCGTWGSSAVMGSFLFGAALSGCSCLLVGFSIPWVVFKDWCIHLLLSVMPYVYFQGSLTGKILFWGTYCKFKFKQLRRFFFLIKEFFHLFVFTAFYFA